MGYQLTKKKALEYFKKGIELNDEYSMYYYYARILENGDEIPVDKKEAAKYYKMSADAGIAESQVAYERLQNNEDDNSTNNEEIDTNEESTEAYKSQYNKLDVTLTSNEEKQECEKSENEEKEVNISKCCILI